MKTAFALNGQAMPYSFTDAREYPYSEGCLYLGLDPDTGRNIGLRTERHAITVAGSRAGKGACLIIPNLMRWPHAVVAIDPKGENALATWKYRKAHGQRVAVLDPFGVSGVPKSVRATFNPLDGIEADTPRARERIEALADGMVVLHDPRHADWAAGARSIIAGLIAYVVGTAPPEYRNLTMVRRLLVQPDQVFEDGATTEANNPFAPPPKVVGGLYVDAQHMLDCDACGGLAPDAGVTIMSGITMKNGMPPQLLEHARRATRWLDAPEMAACLGSTSFNLSDLKRDKLSLFLVLQPDEIRSYSAFFRLFVRAALKVMMTDKPDPHHRCLFILDEFYSLGKIDVIAEAAGLMAGYGVTLWPFVLDIGSLQTLYGHQGSETFFANSDAHVFFGNTDSLTLKYISNNFENHRPNEIEEDAPPAAPFVARQFRPFRDSRWWESEERARERFEIEQRNALAKHNAEQATLSASYQHRMRQSGQSRMQPNEIAAHVGKGNADKVARRMIVFAKSGDVLSIKLRPYYEV